VLIKSVEHVGVEDQSSGKLSFKQDVEEADDQNEDGLLTLSD